MQRATDADNAVIAGLLEYDDERSGDFAPLRLPKKQGRRVGTGDHEKGDLESADLLRRRLDEASAHLPLDQLTLSPQCGFASILPGNLLTKSDQWRKLDLVQEVARQMW